MGSLTVLLTELVAPTSATQPAHAPVFETLLARCTSLATRSLSVEAWLCSQHGVERQHDWPVAPMIARLAGDIHSCRYWICAQPVQLVVDRDSLLLKPASLLNLSDSESSQLFQTLRDYLADDGLEMRYVDAAHWCVGCQEPQELRTTEPVRVAGTSIDGFLPSGKHASRWQHILTEAQMLLHEHPVNHEREQRGAPPVNSVWLWGGGNQPTIKQRYDAINGSQPLARALAAMCNTTVVAGPFSAIHDAKNKNILAVMDHEARDAQDDLDRVESDWIKPAWAALSRGDLDEIRVAIATSQGILEASCDRGARHRFWKRPLPLLEFIDRVQAQK